MSWQITPIALSEATTDLAVAKRAFDAMMTIRKIDIAVIEAARRGSGSRSLRDETSKWLGWALGSKWVCPIFGNAAVPPDERKGYALPEPSPKICEAPPRSGGVAAISRKDAYGKA